MKHCCLLAIGLFLCMPAGYSQETSPAAGGILADMEGKVNIHNETPELKPPVQSVKADRADTLEQRKMDMSKAGDKLIETIRLYLVAKLVVGYSEQEDELILGVYTIMYPILNLPPYDATMLYERTPEQNLPEPLGTLVF